MRQSTKIAKPSKDFPLTPHPTGRWCKKVRGVLHYFGPIDKPQAALDEWLRVKDHLLGRAAPRRWRLPRRQTTTSATLTLSTTSEKGFWT